MTTALTVQQKSVKYFLTLMTGHQQLAARPLVLYM